MKKVMICLLLSTALLISCTSEKDNNKGDTSSSSDKETVQNNKDEKKDTTNNSNNKTNNSNNTTDKTDSSTKNNAKADEIGKKAKDYILNGQGDKPEALKLKWSKAFLDKVNMKSMYEKYLKDGGTDGDVEWFAKYITSYAPISNDWEEMFKKDIYTTYKENIVSIKHINGDLYNGSVKVNGVETDYVTVSARTGYYHGTSNSNNNLGEVKAKVQVYEGAYFDSKCFGGIRLNKYCEVVISNITETSFDFTVNEVQYLNADNNIQTKKVIFKTNRAIFIEDGTKAAFYGKDYTLKFTFPNDHGAFPVVTDMQVTGFSPLEGKTYNNNGIPGHEFG